VSDRVKAIIFFISVAEFLVRHCNFNSLLGVITGLNLTAISRLHGTIINSLNQPKRLNLILSFQSPDQSFKYLREAHTAAGFISIPYLGLFLQDLSRIDEGNPDILFLSGKELINFPKCALTDKAIFELLIHKKAIPELNKSISPLEPLKTFLYELPTITEVELFSLSYLREPRRT